MSRTAIVSLVVAEQMTVVANAPSAFECVLNLFSLSANICNQAGMNGNGLHLYLTMIFLRFWR